MWQVKHLKGFTLVSAMAGKYKYLKVCHLAGLLTSKDVSLEMLISCERLSTVRAEDNHGGCLLSMLDFWQLSVTGRRTRRLQSKSERRPTGKAVSS